VALRLTHTGAIAAMCATCGTDMDQFGASHKQQRP
jgi:hypothetical protein